MSLFNRLKELFRETEAEKEARLQAPKVPSQQASGVGRRGFLKGLLATGAVVAAPEILQASKGPEDGPSIKDKKNFLWAVYFESLKLNEGERLNFYRCTAGKVTVGYGLNAEAHPNLFKNLDMTVYREGRALSAAERSTFLRQLSRRSEAELATYCISKKDAERSAYHVGMDMIDRIRKDLKKETVRGKGIDFFNLPVFAQCVVLDLYYNLGSLKKFPSFERAVRRSDFRTMMAESRVRTSSPGALPSYNEFRETRKQRWSQVARWLYSSQVLKTTVSKNDIAAIIQAYAATFHPQPQEAKAEMNILLGEVCRYCRRPDLFMAYQNEAWGALAAHIQKPSMYQMAQISRKSIKG